MSGSWDISRQRAIRVLAGVALAVQTGCAAYTPSALPTSADTRPSLEGLTIDAARLKLEPLKSIRLDPADGLTPLEIAVLAVLNNPDLAARRVALGVPNAQLLAAGLLPDPQIDLGADHPYSGPDTENAFSISPSLDLATLMGRASNRAAAKATAGQANLDLLWSEWGTAQQARDLAETILADQKRAVPLQSLLQAATDRAGRVQAAVARGDLTNSDLAADLGVKLDAQTQLTQLGQDQAKAERDLHALLGVEPGVPLPLVDGPAAPAIGAPQIAAALAALPNRRPDLLALQAGYEAQDARLRGAILAQFPISQIGAALARDTAGVSTIGLAATLAVPISGVARTQAQVETATREQLRAEYQARLDAARAEAQDAQAQLAGAQVAAAALAQALSQFDALAAPAIAAYSRGEIDSQAYLDLLSASLTRRADLADSRLTARTAQDRLETLLFLPPAEAQNP
ncbi:MAG: TolC family protein [Caulobacteraceae bacterium]|nr:TolC family protein [Caulobacteraceae bacterium]